MDAIKKKILDMIFKKPGVTKEQMDTLFTLQKLRDIPLREVLIAEKLFTDEELNNFFTRKLYLPSLEFTNNKFDPNVVKLIPQDVERKYSIMPIFLIEKNLTIAIDDPLNIFVLDYIKAISEYDVDIVLSSRSDIIDALNVCYGKDNQGANTGIKVELDKKPLASKQVELMTQQTIEISDVIKESENPPIIKLVEYVIAEALKKRASDIHIEPVLDGVRVRYRIDGNLYDIFKLPKQNQDAVLTRIKILSEMDITESRMPQDGRFKVRLEGREVDFRVSALPTAFGQKFVLRALDKSNLSAGLDKLGFSEDPTRVFTEAISKPFGMILVTGPTGSGKSTTLYSVLNKLMTPERHIVTVEDPVEYQIDGITQVQVRSEIGLDFASALRSILRHTPDIIMVGEIRDHETADIAVKASLTGQLVLSTLHTNDAVSSIARLIDMGVEPFLAASSLVMVCAQRLARCICPKCKEPMEAPADLLKEVGFKDKVVFYQGKGCRYCNNAGYYGRIAILEAVLIDQGIREMIMEKRSTDEIKEYAVKNCGMKTLRDDAFKKVADGMITLDEAIRITTQE
ncbi:MAG: GspE/PulE family protein [Candidatus Omnitrophica bacterium]|nr:GspE/PulE family protein [Candidatus Omnitrophota bacterium]